MKTAKHITSKARGPQQRVQKEVNGAKTELQHDIAELQGKGKQLFKSVSNIAKNLDWKDYVKIGAAGAVAVYAFRKRNALVSMAAPVVMGLLTEGIAKAKDLKQEYIHA